MTTIELFHTNKVQSIRDLLRKVTSSAAPTVTVTLPKSHVLSQAALDALKVLPEVYSSVVPTERRDLQASEVQALYNERKALDALEDAIKVRKEAIRTSVVNALDVRLEGAVKDLSHVTRDREGHYVLKSTLPVPGATQVFSWESSEAEPTIKVEDFQRVADSGETELTHADYLACTTQVRVFDPAKFLVRIQERPEIVDALPAIATPGTVRGALYLRKA